MTRKDAPPIVAVVAMAENRIIGDGEKLLWQLPEDLRRVKSITMNKPLIMGRRTFESIGKPLGGRANIVLTKQPDWKAEGALVVRSREQALAVARDWIAGDPARQNEIIIFGGGEIYRAFMDDLDAIELTEVALSPKAVPLGGGVTFPAIDPSLWRETSRQDFPADEGKPAYAFVRLERRH